jgi:putative hydrolase of the HAD superfamily
VSNFDHRLPALLAGLGVADLFQSVLIPARVGYSKPDPRIFNDALESLGVRAAETVFVGDHPEIDLAPAAALGMACLQIDSAFSVKKVPAEILALSRRNTV